MRVRAMLQRYGEKSSIMTPGGGWSALCLTGGCPGSWRTELATAADSEAAWREHLDEHHTQEGMQP